MTKRNDYSYKYPSDDQQIIKKLTDPKYEGGNLVLPKGASMLEKVKYNFCQSILIYMQDNKLSLEELSEKLSFPKEIVYDVCRGKVDVLCLKHLMLCVKKLSISFVLCPNCNDNFLGSRDRQLVSTLKDYEEFLPETQKIYRNLENYQLPF